jgi:hypothetical protein
MDPDPDVDPDTAIFVLGLQDANQKVFLHVLLFEGTFTFFKDKKSKRIDKTVGPRFFLLFWLDDRKIRIGIKMESRIRIRIGIKTMPIH